MAKRARPNASQQKGTPDAQPKRARRARTITNAQTKLLADLQRQLGYPATPDPAMTRTEATHAISRLIIERNRQNPRTISFQKALSLMHETPGTHPWERHTQ